MNTASDGTHPASSGRADSPDLAEDMLELSVGEIAAFRGSIFTIDGTVVIRPDNGPNNLGAILACDIGRTGCDAVFQVVLTARHADGTITINSPDGDIEYGKATVLEQIGPQLVSIKLDDVPQALSIRFRNGLSEFRTELRVHQIKVLLSRKGPSTLSWVREWVKSELPNDIDSTRPSAELALALCDWGHRFIPRAHHWCVLDHDPHFWPFTFPAGEALRRLVMHEAGVYCGGNANAMVEVYRMFGFDAYAIDCGWSESYLTHVVNLVRLPGTSKMLTLCSYFNAVLQHGGKIANLPDALRAMAADAAGDCGFQTINAASRKPYLVQRAYVDDLVELKDPVFEYTLLWEREGVCCFSSRYNIDNDESAPRLNELLQDAFGATGLHLILRRFIAVTEGPEAESLTKTLTAARDTPDAIPAWAPKVHAPRATLLAPSLLDPC